MPSPKITFESLRIDRLRYFSPFHFIIFFASNCKTSHFLSVIVFVFVILFKISAHARTQQYHLYVDRIAHPVIGLNNEVEEPSDRHLGFGLQPDQITSPGPTLRFNEGDNAEIIVHNQLNQPTSIHWHGLLLSTAQDGVPVISQPAIPPHSSYTYKFPVQQSGTYWFHSHYKHQEQSGLVGSIVIEPKSMDHRTHHVALDYAVVLTDWTNRDPAEIHRILKTNPDRENFSKGTNRGLFQDINENRIGDRIRSELKLMPPMDYSDVHYNRRGKKGIGFRINGQSESWLPHHFMGGETLRLRMINASASTYFQVAYGQQPMTVIAADGLDVQSVQTREILIGVGETYDVLVQVAEDRAIELRASAQDGTGYAFQLIGPHQDTHLPIESATEIPIPDPYAHAHGHHNHNGHAAGPTGHSGHSEHSGHVDHSEHSEHSGHAEHAGHSEHAQHADHSLNPPSHAHANVHADEAHDHSQHSGMSMPHHDHSTSSEFIRERLTYQDLVNLNENELNESKESTNTELKSSESDVLVIPLVLCCDMGRYNWSILDANGKPLESIMLRKGQRVRFEIDNRTMMHHPLHLHREFFRLITDREKNTGPFKHTVDIAPYQKITLEFKASEGDSLFHCHFLYHMDQMNFIIHDISTEKSSQMHHGSQDEIKQKHDQHMELMGSTPFSVAHEILLGSNHSEFQTKLNQFFTKNLDLVFSGEVEYADTKDFHTRAEARNWLFQLEDGRQFGGVYLATQLDRSGVVGAGGLFIRGPFNSFISAGYSNQGYEVNASIDKLYLTKRISLSAEYAVQGAGTDHEIRLNYHPNDWLMFSVGHYNDEFFGSTSITH